MGSKIINFKDLKVEHPNRYKVTDSNGTEDVKKIDFDPGLIYQQGTPESAENFNNIQKNCIYEVAGVRILEGQEEIYDISIDGFNNFEFENLKILMTPNTTNTIKGSFVRLNGAKYIIKNRTDSIGIGQIFSDENILLSLNFNRKTADVIGVLGGGYVGSLKELFESKVSKDGDTMTGPLLVKTDKTGSEIKLHTISGSQISFKDLDGKAGVRVGGSGGSENIIHFWGTEDSLFGIWDAGNLNVVGTLSSREFIGPLKGNSATASKLAASIKIGIGNSEKSVDGSSDVSWSLSEIGAVNQSQGSASNLSIGKYLYLRDYDDDSKIHNTYVRRDLFYMALSDISLNGKKVYHEGNKPTKADVGLSDVDNTADTDKKVLSASKLTTGRNITVGKNTKIFDGSQNISFTLSEIGTIDKSDFYSLTDSDEYTTLQSYFRANPSTFNGLYVTREKFTDIPEVFSLTERVEVKVIGNHGGYGKTLILNGSATFLAVQWNSEQNFMFKRIDENYLGNISDGNGVWADRATGICICWGTINSWSQNQTISFPITFTSVPSVANVTQGTDTGTTLSVVMYDITKANFKARCMYNQTSNVRAFSYMAIGRVN